MQDIFYPSADGKNTVHACIWQPRGEVMGVFQIIHGMAEYAERYAPFANFLTEHGFIVCAEDHLGHGKTAKGKEDLGYFNDQKDYKLVLADIRSLHVKLKEQYPAVPYYIMGHSMGSFFCRNYIALYGNELAGAVIMGSGFKDGLTLNTALTAVNLNALLFGWRHRSRLIKNLAFGSYNKRFKPVRTANDWLSKNAENIDNYDADEFCGVDFTDNGYKILFSVIKNACKDATVKAVPKDLPLLLVAGADDPVGDYGKGVEKLYKKLTKAGVKSVKIKLYQGMRHEILNDDCKQEVYKDILDFISG